MAARRVQRAARAGGQDMPHASPETICRRRSDSGMCCLLLPLIDSHAVGAKPVVVGGSGPAAAHLLQVCILQGINEAREVHAAAAHHLAHELVAEAGDGGGLLRSRRRACGRARQRRDGRRGVRCAPPAGQQLEQHPAAPAPPARGHLHEAKAAPSRSAPPPPGPQRAPAVVAPATPCSCPPAASPGWRCPAWPRSLPACIWPSSHP